MNKESQLRYRYESETSLPNGIRYSVYATWLMETAAADVSVSAILQTGSVEGQRKTCIRGFHLMDSFSVY
jgi:hypothetical protein